MAANGPSSAKAAKLRGMQLDPAIVAMGVVWYVVFLLSVTLHEASHALVAFKLGDPTAYEGGQVTLNPLPHIQRAPFGTIAVPLISYALMGWMMGWATAPYDPFWAERHPRRAAWMALAGPIANLFLAIVAGLAIRLGMSLGYLEPAADGSLAFTHLVGAAAGNAEGAATVLSTLFSLNVILFLFNLMPLPPLDGASIMPLVIGERLGQRYLHFMRQWTLLGLIVAWNLFPYVFQPAFAVALRLLYLGLGNS